MSGRAVPSPRDTSPSPKGLSLLRGPLGEASTKEGVSPRDTPSPRESLPADAAQRREFLRALDRDATVIAAACQDADAARGVEFPCRLPGHAKDGRAHVELRETSVVYVCDCDGFERSLTEVYATRIARISRRRTKAEYVRWKVRLALEAGALVAPPVVLPPLADDAREYTVKVYRGLSELLAVRALTDPPGEPFTFARSFAAEWCGVEREQANAATKALVRAGVLTPVGTTPVGAREAILYKIGDGKRSR